MKKVMLSFAFIFIFTFSFYAQYDHEHETDASYEPSFPEQRGTIEGASFSCGWYGESLINRKDFRSNAEAEAVMNDIMNVIGLRTNYTIQAAKVPNAAAVVYGDKRYIYYNPRFISNVTAATNTNWASISIVAHEVGHHLNGHTLIKGGSQRHMELEADEFSGFVLRKMGASLEEAQIAMRKLAGERGTSTHPGKTERLMAIQKGWQEADKQINGYQSQTTVPTTTTSTRQDQPVTTTPSDDNNASSTPDEVDEAPPAFAAYRVTLRSNPGKAYYITTRYNFVAIRGDKVNVLGSLEENNNERYPYKINFENEKIADLLISRKGELYSMKGSIVGSLARINRQPVPKGQSFLGVDVP